MALSTAASTKKPVLVLVEGLVGGPQLLKIRFSAPNWAQMGVSKNRGKTPKMDGENNGKPY